ncbi:MAG: TIGR02281 family clan AA aspartic protease [Gammaproteobacteria bacterium]|jgi:aspartyl protease family protein
MKQRDPHADEQRRLGGWMYVGFWIVLILLLSSVFSRWLDHERNPNQDVVTRVGDNGVREVVLKRNRMGHYYATGSINGHRVEFMLDTGATDIAIPSSVAENLGLRKLGAVQYQTANGIATGYATRLESVQVGKIVLHNLAAGINPHMDGDVVLLGMSFLKRIEFTQRGDTLILRQ